MPVTVTETAAREIASIIKQHRVAKSPSDAQIRNQPEIPWVTKKN